MVTVVSYQQIDQFLLPLHVGFLCVDMALRAEWLGE